MAVAADLLVDAPLASPELALVDPELAAELRRTHSSVEERWRRRTMLDTRQVTPSNPTTTSPSLPYHPSSRPWRNSPRARVIQIVPRTSPRKPPSRTPRHLP